MIALLYRLFKKDFDQLSFDAKHQTNAQFGLKYAFTLQGVNYYAFNSIYEMPLIRLGKIQLLLGQLSACVSDSELNRFIQLMEESLDKATQGSSVQNLAKIGWAITELKNRKKLLVHGDVMLQICSAAVVREGEDAAIWNDENEYRKFELFKAAYSGEGVNDFFRCAGLATYWPALNVIESDLTILLAESEIYLKAQDAVMKSM
jgi:hypothetical protein